MSTEVSSVKLVTFDGNKRNWRVFVSRFKAFLIAKKLKEIFKVGLEIPKAGEEIIQDSTDETSTVYDPDEVRLQELNETTYNLLLLAMDTTTDKGQIAFDMVDSTVSRDYPNGSFLQAWEKLANKYDPKTVTEKKDLEDQYLKLKLKYKEDPEAYFGKLVVLRSRASKPA